MGQLAIRGHKTRGKEVIEILEMLGGKNNIKYDGRYSSCYYFLNDTLICSTYGGPHLQCYTLEEFLEKFPYMVGDKVKVPYKDGRITGNELYEYKILKIKWDSLESTIKYGLPTGNEQCVEYYSADNLNIWNKKETVEEIKIDIPKGYKFAEVDNDKQQVVFTKIQPQYPKTYEECCEVLGIDTQFCMKYLPHGTLSYKDTLIYNLQALLICREAYWKIAGEQMGLGKPWEPDYKDGCTKYTITIVENKIYTDVSYIFSHVLIFPTEEIRDAFCKNFKELIEECKKLI